MIIKVDHIGIAVKNINGVLKLYTETLGLKLKGIEIVQEQKVRTAIIPIAETKIELLEATDTDSPIAKFIEKRGEGLHHIALEVSNIEEALVDMKQKDISIIDVKPRIGVENSSIAFLHPSKFKALLELVELKK